MRNFVLVGLATISAAVAGCNGYEYREQYSQQPISCTPAAETSRLYRRTLPELTYAAIDRMTLCAPPEMSPIVPVIVSSITESQRIGRSSAFGNVVADFARTRLAYRRMNVSEPRLRSSLLLVEDQGEMMLTRDPLYLVTPPPYSAVVTGTYAVTDSSVLVSLKLIRSDNGHIISAADFIVWRADDVDGLLGDLNIAGTRGPKLF